jgi:curved DNA-binding protein CbpA
LGFSPSEPITLELLQQRRRVLARKHHPDRGGSVAKMQTINAAADVLEAMAREQA